MIAIRVDTLCGLGHFMRCKWLALELQCLGEEVVFLVDTQLSDHLTKNSGIYIYYPMQKHR